MNRFVVLAAATLMLATATRSAAQPAGTSAAETAKGESTVLVPPQGGTARIPVHPTTNVLLSFPEPLAPRAVASTKDWEIREFGDGVVARALTPEAKPTTLALATKSGSIKVNITLTLTTSQNDGVTLVRFKASTAEESFQAAVRAEVERQTATLRAELSDIKKAVDIKVRDRAENMVARRLISRLEVIKLSSHDRNDDNVIVHVQRAVFLGEEAYLLFQIENRSGSAYRLAKVLVRTPGGRNHAGPASVVSGIAESDTDLIGVVPPGARASAAVLLRSVDALLAKPLTLELQEPDGRGRVVVSRGIVLR